MREKTERSWGPGDYWHIGPVYVRKQLALLAAILLSAAILLKFGLPSLPAKTGETQFPAYRYNDPELAGISGAVRVLDGENRVRYLGEVAAGAYTGRGTVWSASGELLYDGPLIDGVYQGADAKVYRSGFLVYTGEMAGNHYEGQGRRVDPETGAVSQGQFSRGLLEGQAQELYADGSLLREGTFSRDLLEGAGAEYSQEGVLLREGVFSAGLLHGEGREYTPGGALRYEGQFWRGLYHGQGVLYDTLLGVPRVSGSFAYGRLTGQGTIYHPSGQPLYTGQVCGDRPRADAFLGLSLAEVEAAFAPHWLLYSCEGVTAFVYPYFQLMFITESPVELISQAAGCQEELLSPDTDKQSVVITQVLSYGQTLPCVAQPEEDYVSGRHRLGWREWFSDFASGELTKGVFVRRSGQFVWRFTWLAAEDPVLIDEFLAQQAGVETMTARREDKDMSLWYQTAKWREGS